MNTLDKYYSKQVQPVQRAQIFERPRNETIVNSDEYDNQDYPLSRRLRTVKINVFDQLAEKLKKSCRLQKNPIHFLFAA